MNAVMHVCASSVALTRVFQSIVLFPATHKPFHRRARSMLRVSAFALLVQRRSLVSRIQCCVGAAASSDSVTRCVLSNSSRDCAMDDSTWSSDCVALIVVKRIAQHCLRKLLHLSSAIANNFCTEQTRRCSRVFVKQLGAAQHQPFVGYPEGCVALGTVQGKCNTRRPLSKRPHPLGK